MPSVETNGRKYTVRVSPSHAGTLEIQSGDMVLFRMTKSVAKAIAFLLREVAYELPDEEDECPSD